MIGEISGLTCAAAWAVISMVMRSVATRMNPVAVNGLRCIFAALTLGVVVLVSGRIGSLLTMPGSVAGAIVLSGILGQAVGDAAYVRSAKAIGVSRALPLSSSSPLLTMILAALFLGETVNALNAIGAILVFAGIILLAIPYGPLLAFRDVTPADRAGLLTALLAAICYTVSTVVLKSGLGEVDILAVNLLRMSTAAVILTGWQVSHEGARPPLGLSGRTLRVMVLTGLLSAFSSTMYVTSVQFAGAAKASILTSTSPLFGLPMALIFLRERVSRRVLLGTVASVAGIWLVLWR